MLEYYQTENVSQNARRPNPLKMQQLADARKTAYSGTLKEGTKRRLTRAIDLLVQVSKTRYLQVPGTRRITKHRLSFITLTVSSHTNITAREAYDKLLSPFLKWLRDSCQCKTYIWKIELQKRGQIHYHITTPAYIYHKAIRQKWNYLQQKAGTLDDYYKMKGHYDANSTDIHGVNHVKNLANYLIKEYVKTYQNPEIIGKTWDCSLNLKAYSYFTFEDMAAIGIKIHNMAADGLIEIISLEQCRIIKYPTQGMIELMPLDIIKRYDDFTKLILAYTREKKVP